MVYVDYDGWDGHDPDTSWTEAVNRFLAASQDQQHARLTAELDRIVEQLDRRDAIHAEIVDDLEWQINRYTDRLEQLYRSRTGKQDDERAHLKDRIDTFRQRLRDEHRSHWRDRQDLEEERRAIRRELAEIEDTDLSEVL
ncbi:hypothetical protein [Halobiforma nitratireducens]|uniref:Calcium binding protein n=1 Tax=Halobiforma nitratireducens JCM 10879 TaxID=1227454 RepID=M0M0G2_9EURY|nr:hypothetical protein [Halobiforma nitratireducens]EMA39161.1 calcium binding protein [Halobiforma nitratireducens JCM 10879]